MYHQIAGLIFVLSLNAACDSKAPSVEADAADVSPTDVALADAADATPDVADAADVPLVDVPDGAPTTDCAQLVKDWAVFVATHAGCVADADCTVVGGAYSCDLGAPIGQGSGDAIAKSAKDAADVYLNAFYGPACKTYRDSHGVSDAAPATNLRCAAGSCKADSASCLVPPDAGDTDVADATSSDTVDVSGGYWTLFTFSQGGFCAPESNCFSTWQISPSGAIAAKKGGVDSQAAMSGTDLATLNAAIDNLAFLNKMKGGFSCGIPPTDISYAFSYALSGTSYNQDVTGCELSGGQDGALVQGIVTLIQKY